ncbi:Mu transposase C-terminal domain-containing protein [Rhodocyclus tenuis]|nr:Mu transposase C-terminal domain-containing protein [Rhodocyclus tenuis]
MNAPLPSAITCATLADIAAALQISKQGVAARANRESWAFDEQSVRGGKQRRYPLATLPKDVRDAVQLQALHAMSAAQQPIASADAIEPLAYASAQFHAVARKLAIAPASNQTAIQLRGPEDEELDRDQRACELARDRILNFVAGFPGSTARAIDHLNAERHAQRLPAPLSWAFDHAWDKPRADNRLTLKTYYNWAKVKKTRGRAAPVRRTADLSVKPWHALAVTLRQRPQGSCLNWITDQVAEQWQAAWGEKPVSYHVIRRFFTEKFSQIDQLKGRHTGSALRAHKHWKPRTSAGLLPWQEVHADGWNTHFTAPHPITGEYVTYEVWHFHDVATRYVPPPGIGLTETFEVITAGLERCVRAGGLLAVLQTDSTKVVKRSPRFTQDEFIALSERAGMLVVHPKEVGNSQANGICENFNTWLDKKSRALATYQGKGMDSLTLRRVKKLTEKMVKAANVGDLAERDRYKAEAERTGKGIVFTSRLEAEKWINDTCDEWNDKPHRSLPKICDPATGKKRHQTPREALQQHIDAGWKPVAIEEHHIVDLFRPRVRCKVVREAVSPIGKGQRYHFPGLGAWNGEEVSVAIDPQDWRAVWIETLRGEFIGVADLVEASGYRAQTQYEIAEEKRAAAQMRLLNKKIERVQARTGLTLAVPASTEVVIGGRIIDHAELQALPAAAPAAPTREQKLHARATAIAPAAPTPRSERPASENYAEWCALDARLQAGDTISDADARWHRTYPQSAQYRAECKKKAAA